MRRHQGFVLTLGAMVLAAASSASAQQFQVHSWESFESSTLPETLRPGHMASAQNLEVYSYENPGIPPGMMLGRAPQQIGTYGLRFTTSPYRFHLSLLSNSTLDRSTLQTSGRALVQADIFVPADGDPVPNTALVAALPTESGGLGYEFYRFGLKEGGKNVFFSFTNGGDQPAVFVQQEISRLNLTRPAWHRFQIVFVGQEEIYCAIDGQRVGFPPIKEASLKQLNAGIMVTSKQNTVSYVDNLSIQTTTDEAPLPLSPWVMEGQVAGDRQGSLLEDPAVWTDDPSRAWRIAREQNKPILTLFYVPGTTAYSYLQTLAPNDQAMKELLSNYVPLRLDANQLMGGRLAQRFSVIRIPTFLVIGPDGRERNRLTVEGGKTTWAEISDALK